MSHGLDEERRNREMGMKGNLLVDVLNDVTNAVMFRRNRDRQKGGRKELRSEQHSYVYRRRDRV